MLKSTISLCFALTLFITLNLAAQDMAPPQASNAVYDALVGDWTGESNMMGAKMSIALKIYWDLNHQFLVMELKSTGVDNPAQTYQGKGLFGLDQQGNAKGWWFDSWGANSVGTATGTFSDNKVTLTGGNDMYKETRSFQVNGNEMIMSANGTMNMGGKEVPFDETVTFRR